MNQKKLCPRCNSRLFVGDGEYMCVICGFRHRDEASQQAWLVTNCREIVRDIKLRGEPFTREKWQLSARELREVREIDRAETKRTARVASPWHQFGLPGLVVE